MIRSHRLTDPFQAILASIVGVLARISAKGLMPLAVLVLYRRVRATQRNDFVMDVPPEVWPLNP